VRSKLWTVLTALLIASMILGACAPAATPTPTPRPQPTTPPPTAVPTEPPPPRLSITVATDATWPPFEYVDETTKEIVGFDADLMTAIAEAADFDFEFVNVAWDPLLAGMATGEYDAAISAMTITEERAKQWDFSEPYFSAGQLIAVRVDETGIEGPDDLAGKTAGAQIGTTGAIYIEENIPDATLKTYDEISQAFLDLINGQIDAVVADDPLVEAMVEKYTDVIVVGGVLTAEEYGIAVKQGAADILEAINKGLQMVKDQGLIEQLKAKWIEVEAPAALTIGEVTDMGGVDDKSFNQTAWAGVEMAVEQLGAEGKFLESQQQADYAKNIQQFVDEKLDLIVTVGYLLGVDTATAAVANPEQKFAIVDYEYPDCWPGAEPGKDCGSDAELPNVLGLMFATDEAAFLAGYLAAGVSKTGKVGAFGGIQIPTVTIFMKGMEAGVKYYNQVHGTNVELLGWDSASDEGLFTGNFESTDDGRRFAESLMDEGADIIMPVAGPVGLGSAAACLERGTMLIGVDTDWYISAPEFQPTYLTSVVKNIHVAVFAAAKAVANGTFAGGTYVGTLANDGVGIAPFHDYAGDVSADLEAELDDIKALLIAGTLTVDGVLSGEIGPVAQISIGEVTDMGGVDDKSFNQTAWAGVEMAVEQLGAEGKFLESQQQADYAKNIQQFVDEKLDLIVTVGYLLGVDTATAAVANPEQKFAIVDYEYPDCWPGAEPGKDCGSDAELPNVLGLMFATDEAAFLAGYLAAGVSKTGKVGAFGGIQIPTVTIFMKGMEAGVKYYNQVHGTNVELLGWDSASDEGLFTGNFESTDDGRRFAESLMDEGADIIMPVAGPVGLGSAAACLERGTMLIGVDTDWYISAPEFQPTYLTSVVKNIHVAVFAAAKAVANGTFAGGTYVGTLANDGVGIAPFHDYASDVSADLEAELDEIKADLIDGTITVDGVLGL
jgi:basic membrane protein A